MRTELTGFLALHRQPSHRRLFAELDCRRPIEINFARHSIFVGEFAKISSLLHQRLGDEPSARPRHRVLVVAGSQPHGR